MANRQMTLAEIIKSYSPYDKMESFGEGFRSYECRNFFNPYPADGVMAQAWDRGLEAAMKWQAAGKP